MQILQPGCLLLDLDGCELSAQEREMLQHPLVAGVILFSRNYHDKAQLRALCKSIYEQRSPCVICVDQEGGRVQRFMDGFERLPSMRDIAENYSKDAPAVKRQLSNVIRSQLGELKDVGINVNLAPVLDLDDGVSAVIGERSLGSSPEQVIDLAHEVLAVHAQLNMPAVGKHFPGHGGVSLDSHAELPVDDRSLLAITQSDLSVFASLAPYLDAVMTAHIVFSQVDEQTPTFSRRWLGEILRDQLQFKGVIFSDDLSMQGACQLANPVDRCRQALTAGCDLLLLCNDREASIAVLDGLKQDSNTTGNHRVQRWCHQLRGPWCE